MANIPMQIDGETVCVLLEDVGKAGIKALIYLFRKGETNVYQMTLKGSMGTGNTRSVLLQLHKLGLVEDKEGKGNETIYSLSVKGKRVAEHLDAAERILSEST